ncbi:MAG: MBL fold metallo-hydrolase [Actinomycetota bacterium]
MPLAIYEHLVVGALSCNCYVVGDPETKDAIVIDPGDDIGVILEAIDRHGLKVAAIVATHAHFDHVLAAEDLRLATGAPFFIHKDDLDVLGWLGPSLQMFMGITEPPPPPVVDVEVTDGDQVTAGGLILTVLHTPGHSPGSISLLAQGEALFCGDTLFAGSIGRTDLPGGDYEAEIASIKQRLLPLGDLPVYPGHGPSTTLDRERSINPFLH